MIVTNDRRRELAAKVRDVMGELATIELDGVPLADLIEPTECDGCEPGAWEVVAMEAAERLGVAVGGCLPSDYADSIGEALDRRLMPEGYEWPTVDGEPLSEGSVFVCQDGSAQRAWKIVLSVYDGVGGRTGVRFGEELHGPAPKALDADDVETRVGDKVWSTSGAFDGARTVSRVICDDDEFPPYAMFEERREPWSCLCCCLTHERPDSWERLEEDANALAEAETNGRGSYNAANDYCNAHGLEDDSVWVLMARDLVRRAKALAERGK